MSEQIMIETNSTRYSSLRDCFDVIFRYKWRAFLFFVFVCAATVMATSFMKDLYRSEAKLLVRLGWESVNPDPTATTSEGGGGRFNQPQVIELNTVLDILKTQAVAESIVDKLGVRSFFEPYATSEQGKNEEGSALDSVRDTMTGAVDKLRDIGEDILEGKEKKQHLSMRQQAVRALMDNTEVNLLTNTAIVSLSFTAPSPELARDVVQELTDIYLEKNKLVYRNPNSYAFLEEQEKEAREEVERIEMALKELKQKSGITSLQSRLDFVEEKVGRLEQELEMAETEVEVTTAKIDDLRNQLSKLEKKELTSESTARDYTIIDELRARLLELQSEEQDLLSKFPDDTKQVKDKRRQIAQVEAQIANETPREIPSEIWGLNASYQRAEVNLRTEETTLKAAETRMKLFQSKFAEAKKEREALIELEFRFSLLERELSKQKTIWSVVAEDLNQANLEQALDENSISNVSVVQEASYPLSSEDSQKLYIVIAGFLAAIGGGIVLTFIFAAFDHTLKRPEEVEERLGLPNLVAIPRFRASKVSLRAKVRGPSNVSA